MKDLKQRVEAAIYDWNKYMNVVEGDELVLVIKALTEREAKLVDLLKECQTHIPEITTHKLAFLYDRIEATLKELGVNT